MFGKKVKETSSDGEIPKNGIELALSAKEKTYLKVGSSGILAYVEAQSDQTCITGLLLTDFDQVSEILPDHVMTLLRSEPAEEDICIVGRIRVDRERCLAWPIVDDEKLNSFVGTIAKKYINAINRYGKWTSLSEYLCHTIDYDAETSPPTDQIPLDYFWLIGPRKRGASIYPLPILDRKMGLFLGPEANILHVYSSRLYAEMAAYEYSRKHEIDVKADHIKCLGCFMGGVAGLLQGKIKSALLDNQWEIKFYSCDRHGYHKPTHFFLEESADDRYALFQCREEGKMPIWCKRKWDSGSLFQPACQLKAW